MNITPLFKIQKSLDDEIKKQKKLEGQNLLRKKCVALICELYECVNEARFFKFWSEDQEPKTEYVCELCEGNKEISSETAFGTYEMGFDVHEVDVTCPVCIDVDEYHNPLLEEYVDTIHFVISLGNDIGYTSHKYIETQPRDLNDLVIGITNAVTVLSVSPNKDLMESILNNIIALGYQLGFDERQVIEAYHKKNKKNHERQLNGY